MFLLYMQVDVVRVSAEIQQETLIHLPTVVVKFYIACRVPTYRSFHATDLVSNTTQRLLTYDVVGTLLLFF